MNTGVFQALFMAECATKELHPLEEAAARVKSIDGEILKINSVRAKMRDDRRALVDFLKQKGVEANHQKYSPDEIDLPLEDDTKEAMEMRRKICNLLCKDQHLTVRDIMDKTKTNYESQANLIRQIKLLAEKQVIARDENALIIQGIAWDKRDQIVV